MITTLDKNIALVLIDLQKSIVQLPVAHPIDKVLENSARLLAAFREAKQPVVMVNVNPAGSAAFKTRRDSNPTGGSVPGADFLYT